MLHVPPVDVAASSHERVARDLHGRAAVELPNDSKNLSDWRVRSARVPAQQVGRLAMAAAMAAHLFQNRPKRRAAGSNGGTSRQRADGSLDGLALRPIE